MSEQNVEDLLEELPASELSSHLCQWLSDGFNRWLHDGGDISEALGLDSNLRARRDALLKVILALTDIEGATAAAA
jgi:hypothetical protein